MAECICGGARGDGARLDIVCPVCDRYIGEYVGERTQIVGGIQSASPYPGEDDPGKQEHAITEDNPE